VKANDNAIASANRHDLSSKSLAYFIDARTQPPCLCALLFLVIVQYVVWRWNVRMHGCKVGPPNSCALSASSCSKLYRRAVERIQQARTNGYFQRPFKVPLHGSSIPPRGMNENRLGLIMNADDLQHQAYTRTGKDSQAYWLGFEPVVQVNRAHVGRCAYEAHLARNRPYLHPEVTRSR